MNRPKRLLFWTPRILALLFAALISIFAADVFGEHLGFWKTMLALLIHLIPTWIILGILAVSWRRGWIGAALYPGLGLIYVVMAWGRFPLITYFAMAGPLFLLGILFWIDWWSGRATRPGIRT